jgi:peptidoglycan hydrolase-like protein with peptidoglycan-binding domain
MTTGTISPWPLVRKGDRQHPVKTLQYLLRARGHNLTVDGIFGPNTDAAVRAFQQQKGLAVDGIVGPNTWSALIVTVKQGSRGDAVRGVQEEFQFRNLSGDPSKGLQVDGIFGPKTDAAVRASSRPCIRTSRRSPWTASSGRSPGGRWSAACSPSD